MPDHREFVALLAPIGVWSADGRRLVGTDWKGRVPAPVIDPGTRDGVGRIDRVGVTAVGLVGVGLLDLTGVYLAKQGYVLEVDLNPAVADHVLDEDGGVAAVEFRSGEVVSAWLGTTPAWPDVWLRLDEKACPDCMAPVGVVHAECDVARCLVTGLQRLSCFGEHDHGADVWTGEWPGTADARVFGWYARATPSGWTPCTRDTPGAVPDLNRLVTEATWDPEAKRWAR